MPRQEKLLLPISETSLSNEFKAFASANGFIVVGDVLKCSPASLIKMSGFNNHLLVEWIEFLERYRMAHLLKD